MEFGGLKFSQRAPTFCCASIRFIRRRSKSNITICQLWPTVSSASCHDDGLSQPFSIHVGFSLLDLFLGFPFTTFRCYFEDLWRVIASLFATAEAFSKLYRKNCIQSIQCCISRRSKTAKIKCYKL